MSVKQRREAVTGDLPSISITRQCELHSLNRKRVQRLMGLLGIRAIYRKPKTSKPAKGHKVYTYLLKGLEINHPNQVWAADITYIPMTKGFLFCTW
jgi:putative transposase